MYVPQTRVLGIISGYQVELGTSVNRVPCTQADSLYVYLMTTEIVLVNPHPLRPTAPRSHMYTGVSVITTQPVILCHLREIDVFKTREKSRRTPWIWSTTPHRSHDGVKMNFLFELYWGSDHVTMIGHVRAGMGNRN